MENRFKKVMPNPKGTENRKYWVITLAPDFRVKSLVVGLDRANLLVNKNKDTLAKYEIPCSVFVRRYRR